MESRGGRLRDGEEMVVAWWRTATSRGGSDSGYERRRMVEV